MDEKTPVEDYQVVILVGGLGTRLRPYSNEVPKPMINVDGRPFLEIKLDTLRKQGIKKFVFCVGHLGSIIEKHFGDGSRFGVEIEYSYEKELLGTAGALKNAERLIRGPRFILLNGDTYLDVDIRKLIDSYELGDNHLSIVVCKATHPRTQELVEFEMGKIRKIHNRGQIGHEALLSSNQNLWVNGGVYILNKEILKHISPEKKVSLERDILPRFLDSIGCFIHEGYFFDIADEGDWKEFIKDFNQGFIIPSVSKYNKLIRSRAPVRITFGGGGTDIPPYDREYGGVCVGATINKYVYSSLKLRDDKKIKIKSDIILAEGKFESFEESFEDISLLEKDRAGKLKILKETILEMDPSYGFELYVRSEVPTHSGLGASASLCVSIIGAFNKLRKKERLTRHEIAETAFKIEEERLKNRGGRQDQYAATFGGINLYKFFGGNNVQIDPLEMDGASLLEFKKNILVAFTGSRDLSSGEVHLEEKSQRIFNLFEKLKRLHEIKENGIEIDFNLRRGNLKRIGELIKDGWNKKKEFNYLVSNEHIDSLINEAISNGAIGARLMGAGGGGHLLIYCRPDYEHKVREALSGKGSLTFDFDFDFDGLQVWEIDEDRYD